MIFLLLIFIILRLFRLIPLWNGQQLAIWTKSNYGWNITFRQPKECLLMQFVIVNCNNSSHRINNFLILQKLNITFDVRTKSVHEFRLNCNRWYGHFWMKMPGKMLHSNVEWTNHVNDLEKRNSKSIDHNTVEKCSKKHVAFYIDQTIARTNRMQSTYLIFSRSKYRPIEYLWIN